MLLSSTDWAILIAVLAITFATGLIVSRRAGRSSASFFLGNRNMPWWLLGLSMVATTFAADTPNLVTQIVRSQGVSGNWIWWGHVADRHAHHIYLCKIMAAARRRHRCRILYAPL